MALIVGDPLSVGVTLTRDKGGLMIARVWRGYTTPAHADAYESMLKPELLPGLSRVKGFRGSYLLRRAEGNEVEFITIIMWDSTDDLRAVAGADYETAIVPEERRRYLARYDAKASHYQVVSTQSAEGSENAIVPID
jgi:heme-degrading monooxygenase HmoA